MLQLLEEDGSAAAPAGRTDARRLREALRWMQVARVFDARAIALQRQGKSLTYAGMHGQEAALVGSALALDPARDWMAPQYRGVDRAGDPWFLLARFFLYLRGHPVGGLCGGREDAAVRISVGSQITHAVELAWG
jgi:pyruvate dehydrogenase E1 component alpha subunit